MPDLENIKEKMVFVARFASLCVFAFGFFSFFSGGTALAADQPTCLDRPATIVATGPGTVNGTNGNDVIVGSDEGNAINGKGGNDVICGGFGDDVIDGGSGNDTIDDFNGANLLKGGPGADHVAGEGTVDGGSGNDDVSAKESCAGCGDARALGGSGNDEVGSEGGVADGGSGNDVVLNTFEGDRLFGGSGNDRLVNLFNQGDVVMNGGTGRDACDGDTATTTFVACETFG